MQEYDGRQQFSILSITKADFRLCIHDLSLMALNFYISNMTDNSLGKTKEVDLEVGKVEWDEYMRVRFKMGVTKLLVRKKKLSKGDME